MSFLNIYVDVSHERGGDSTHCDVEGLETGTAEELGRLMASAARKEPLLKDVLFSSVFVILFNDGHISGQDLAYSLEALAEGNYEATMDVLEYMEK